MMNEVSSLELICLLMLMSLVIDPLVRLVLLHVMELLGLLIVLPNYKYNNLYY